MTGSLVIYNITKVGASIFCNKAMTFMSFRRKRRIFSKEVDGFVERKVEEENNSKVMPCNHHSRKAITRNLGSIE